RVGIDARVAVSVVVPVFNEEPNVEELYDRITAVLSDSVEFIFVDDGSTDGTFERLRRLAAADPRIRLVRFRRNFGQTAALSAGIDHARADIIVPMDGDLQNDPRDIPRLLAQLDEGYDVVSGCRGHMRDSLSKRLLS